MGVNDDEYTPWRELASAIMEQTVKDYRAALRAHRRHPSMDTRKAVDALEKWLRGDYCALLLQDIDSDTVIREARKREGIRGDL